MSPGLLSQPEPCWHLVPTCPHFSCHIPPAPHSTDSLLPSATWCGSLAELRGERGNQTAIWNLNETKFISLCCHFIFHRLDGESTGDPRGPFWFAHRVEKQEGGGKWLRDRRPGPFHQPPCSHSNQTGKGQVLSFETNHESQIQEADEGPFSKLKTCSDQNRTGREEPPQCQALTCSQIQTELASGHHRNCYYKFRWYTRGCLIFYYCGWSREPFQQ